MGSGCSYEVGHTSTGEDTADSFMLLAAHTRMMCPPGGSPASLTICVFSRMTLFDWEWVRPCSSVTDTITARGQTVQEMPRAIGSDAFTISGTETAISVETAVLNVTGWEVIICSISSSAAPVHLEAAMLLGDPSEGVVIQLSAFGDGCGGHRAVAAMVCTVYEVVHRERISVDRDRCQSRLLGTDYGVNHRIGARLLFSLLELAIESHAVIDSVGGHSW